MERESGKSVLAALDDDDDDDVLPWTKIMELVHWEDFHFGFFLLCNGYRSRKLTRLPNSKLQGGCLHFSYCWCPSKRHESNYFQSSYGWIEGQTGFFMVTGLRERKVDLEMDGEGCAIPALNISSTPTTKIRLRDQMLGLGLVWFYGISTILGYLMSNHLNTFISNTCPVGWGWVEYTDCISAKW